MLLIKVSKLLFCAIIVLVSISSNFCVVLPGIYNGLNTFIGNSNESFGIWGHIYFVFATHFM